jgi:hypothetical protein
LSHFVFQIILSFSSCSIKWLGAGKPLTRALEAVRFTSLLLSQLPQLSPSKRLKKIREPQQLKYRRHHQLLSLQMLQHLLPLEETRMTPGMTAMEKMRMMRRRKKKMTTTATARTTASTTMATLLPTRVMVLTRWGQLVTFTPQ